MPLSINENHLIDCMKEKQKLLKIIEAKKSIIDDILNQKIDLHLHAFRLQKKVNILTVENSKLKKQIKASLQFDIAKNKKARLLLNQCGSVNFILFYFVFFAIVGLGFLIHVL